MRGARVLAGTALILPPVPVLTTRLHRPQRAEVPWVHRPQRAEVPWQQTSAWSRVSPSLSPSGCHPPPLLIGASFFNSVFQGHILSESVALRTKRKENVGYLRK